MYTVLCKTESPLHADQIVDALLRGGYKDSPSLKMSVSTTARRRSDLFQKTDRNTFGLINGARSVADH